MMQPRQMLITIAAFFVSCSCLADNTIGDLLNDMKHYVTTSKHRGDLWQHSIWTAQMLGRWARGCEQPIKGCLPIKELIGCLNAREVYLLEVAGLIHDIGKAGDLAFEKYPDVIRNGDTIFYCSRTGHERLGFEYILHDMPWAHDNYRAYQMIDGTYFNFHDFFHTLNISDDEQKVVAILVGGHGLLRDYVFASTPETIVQKVHALVDALNVLVCEAGYSKGITRALMSMWLLLQFADTYTSIFPVSDSCATALFAKDFIVVSPHLYPEDDARARVYLSQLFPKLERAVHILNEMFF